ncbi:TPA: hypothetical protein SOL44_003019 [Clostridioides difficile]|nr:hypothetical protein [Clostridioides difficile]
MFKNIGTYEKKILQDSYIEMLAFKIFYMKNMKNKSNFSALQLYMNDAINYYYDEYSKNNFLINKYLDIIILKYLKKFNILSGNDVNTLSKFTSNIEDESISWYLPDDIEDFLIILKNRLNINYFHSSFYEIVTSPKLESKIYNVFEAIKKNIERELSYYTDDDDFEDDFTDIFFDIYQDDAEIIALDILLDSDAISFINENLDYNGTIQSGCYTDGQYTYFVLSHGMLYSNYFLRDVIISIIIASFKSIYSKAKDSFYMRNNKSI